jgi:transcription initiation factor TFIID subunit 11
MTSPISNFSTPLTFANSSVQSPVVPQTPTSAGRGRPRGSGTGAKRGRRPKTLLGSNSPRVDSPAPGSSTASPVFPASSPQFQQVQWPTNTGDDAEGSILQGGISRRTQSQVVVGEQGSTTANTTVGVDSQAIAPSTVGSMPPPSIGVRPLGMDEDADVDDELLPAMADDDYSAQQSWNTQSKDNLKYAFSFVIRLTY